MPKSILSKLKKRKTYIHKVPDDLVGKFRLRTYIKGRFPYLETGSAVKKAIQKKQIKLDAKVGSTGDWVMAGSIISYELIYDIPKVGGAIVEVLYEDHDLVVVRKPPGVASSGNHNSLQLRLQGLPIEDYNGSLPYPYLVHRLDKATEGLLIAAKNMETRRLLALMLENHSIIKDYVCIVEGVIDESMKWITAQIDDKPAKTEIIDSIILNTKDVTSKVFVRLHSGRTHQIRKHFKDIGHPIIGDRLYDTEGLSFGTGLLLCAYHLQFKHPISNKTITVRYPIPTKISKY